MRITNIRKLTPAGKLKQLEWEYSFYCSIPKCAEKFECSEEIIIETLITLGIFGKRKCTQCLTWKLFCEFHKYLRSPAQITTKCKDCRNQNGKEYHMKEDVRERHRNYLKIYNQTDTAKRLKREYYKNKIETDPIFKLHHLISSGLRDNIKKNYNKTSNILEFTFEELSEILNLKDPIIKSEFMNGKLHLDHIRPISSFKNIDSMYCKEFKECWGINNLQLLPARINLIKHDKWDGTPENINYNLKYVTLEEIKEKLNMIGD